MSKVDPNTLMLSVSGLRGLVGHSLTPVVAAKYAAAFGSWLRESTGQASPHVVIGRDSRPSGEMTQHAAVSGLLAVGCKVTTLGIVTTPGVAIMTRHLGAQGGMVITASHNPVIWNGIKALRHDGVAPPADQAQQIIDRFKNESFSYVEVGQIQSHAEDDSTHDVHVNLILEHLDVPAIQKLKPKVVLDSVHGAGGPGTAQLLNALGVELIHQMAEPNGNFPEAPEPTAENLTRLSDAVKEHQADIGFAQDPDADRLALVDENGTYIGEEYTLALATMQVLRHTPGPVAANLSTSRMVDDIAAEYNSHVLRTAVGEANVAARMSAENAVVGGEGNGGIIWPKVINVRDSMVGIGLVLQLMAETGQSLSELVASIPSYTMIKNKQPIQPGTAEPVIASLKQHYANENLDDQDGLRINFETQWIHVRPSNTEPILRVIAEGRDEQATQKLVEQVSELVNQALPA